MMIDIKKEQKDLYQPITMPSIIDVPEMVFIAVDDKGDPNTSAEYAAAIEGLYWVVLRHLNEQQIGLGICCFTP